MSGHGRHTRRELDGTGTRDHMGQLLMASPVWQAMLDMQKTLNADLAVASKSGRQDRDLHKSIRKIVDQAWCPCFRKAGVNFCSCT